MGAGREFNHSYSPSPEVAYEWTSTICLKGGGITLRYVSVLIQPASNKTKTLWLASKKLEGDVHDLFLSLIYMRVTFI
jgi:hypothetical protein